VTFEMLVHNLYVNGFEAVVTSEMINGWFDVYCESIDTKWGCCSKEDKDNIFSCVRRNAQSIGIDTSLTTQKSRIKFCNDLEQIAAETGVTVSFYNTGEAGEAIKKVPVDKDILHNVFIKKRFMKAIDPKAESTNQLSKKSFSALQKVIERWAIDVGVRNLPPFPDRNRVPVGCY
jgi:hypothetical protein